MNTEIKCKNDEERLIQMKGKRKRKFIMMDTKLNRMNSEVFRNKNIKNLRIVYHTRESSQSKGYPVRLFKEFII